METRRGWFKKLFSVAAGAGLATALPDPETILETVNKGIRPEWTGEFSGGSEIRIPFIYSPMIGGAYSKGDSFSLHKREVIMTNIEIPKW